MRISDWSSDVCSSDLGAVTGLLGANAIAATTVAVESVVLRHLEHQLANLGSSDPAAVAAISAIVAEARQHHDHSANHVQAGTFWPKENGRASCREDVCQSVWISGVGVSLKKKN